MKTLLFIVVLLTCNELSAQSTSSKKTEFKELTSVLVYVNVNKNKPDYNYKIAKRLDESYYFNNQLDGYKIIYNSAVSIDSDSVKLQKEIESKKYDFIMIVNKLGEETNKNIFNPYFYSAFSSPNEKNITALATIYDAKTQDVLMKISCEDSGMPQLIASGILKQLDKNLPKRKKSKSFSK